MDKLSSRPTRYAKFKCKGMFCLVYIQSDGYFIHVHSSLHGCLVKSYPTLGAIEKKKINTKLNFLISPTIMQH